MSGVEQSGTFALGDLQVRENLAGAALHRPDDAFVALDGLMQRSA